MNVHFLKQTLGVIIIVLIGIAVSGATTSCRRSLDCIDDFPVGPVGSAWATIHLDWDKSAIDTTLMNYASVWLFPSKTPETPVRLWFIKGNFTERSVKLPIDTYSALVINNTGRASDWTGIHWVDTTNYSSFSAETRLHPDYPAPALLSKSVDRLSTFFVKQFIVSATNGDDKLQSTTNRLLMQPKQVTFKITVKAVIQNLDNATTLEGRLSDMQKGMYLDEFKPKDLTTHVFTFDNRVVDAVNPAKGEVSSQFFVFEIPNTTHRFSLIATLLNGQKATIDVDLSSDKIKRNADLSYLLEIGTLANPIVLPEYSKPPVDNNPDIDSWPETDHPLI